MTKGDQRMTNIAEAQTRVRSWERYAPLTGVLAVVLWVIGTYDDRHQLGADPLGLPLGAVHGPGQVALLAGLAVEAQVDVDAPGVATAADAASHITKGNESSGSSSPFSSPRRPAISRWPRPATASRTSRSVIVP